MIGSRLTKPGKLLHGIAVGTAAAAIALLLWALGALDRWEYVTWAWRVEVFAEPGPATPRIKLILLDQNSLDWGRKENGWSWPWPREVYSAIIDYCGRQEARAVIFDVLYTESSVYGVADDQVLGSAIARGPAFVAPLSLEKRAGGASAWPSGVPLPHPLRLEGLEKWLEKSESSRGIVMSSAVLPIMEVAAHAALLANVTDEPDVDGIFRRGYLFRVFDGKAVPSLGFAGFLAGSLKAGSQNAESSSKGSPSVPSADRSLPVMRIEQGSLHVGGKTVPIDGGGKAILRFRGPSGVYETFSAAAVIQSELRLREGKPPAIEDPSSFKDSYVFFGFSAPGLFDLRPTPISHVYPGVAIYATMLDNLLSDDFLRKPPDSLVILCALLSALLGGIAVVRCTKVWHSTLYFALLLPTPGVLGFAAYELGYWWPVVLSETALALALVAAVVLNYATEGRQKAFIKKAFKYYLSPAVIERILEDPSQLKLGGERRELTILFSDLQGFSSISERLDPQALTSLLNDYLSDMTEIILDEGGTLDKYEGDAIIAFWNAPVAQSDHAVRACRAAIRCQRKLRERRDEFLRRTGALMHARIGINTGEVVVGNMGSRNRFDYTVLGDAANLASRLEGANKAFGTPIMIAETTFLQTKGELVCREIGLLRVVGRKTPVRVYEPTGLSSETDGTEWDELHRGLTMCYEGKWAEALGIFEGLPNDPVARIYSERCRTLAGDPTLSWDGVWSLTEK